MSSLKGLIAILGITAFAGIGGLLVLEELCNKVNEPKRVRLPRVPSADDELEDVLEVISPIESKQALEPYEMKMLPIDDFDKKSTTSKAESQQTGSGKQSEDHDLPPRKNVIFEFHDESDDDDIGDDHDAIAEDDPPLV